MEVEPTTQRATCPSRYAVVLRSSASMSQYPAVELLALPSDWWLRRVASQIFSAFLLEHIVQLYVRYSEAGQVKRRVSNGFLLDLDAQLLWLSAGHVVAAIDQLHQQGTLSDLRWIDRFPVVGAQTLPSKKQRLDAYTDSKGDFGAILLSPLESLHFRSNPNLRPFIATPSAPDLAMAKPEGHIFVGFPEENTTVETKPANSKKELVSLTASFICLPLRLTAPPSPPIRQEMWDDPDAIYAQVIDFVDSPGTQPQEFVGMSGGPVLAFWREPSRIVLTMVGVFASYIPHRRLIRAEPL